jgi:hypothetical protein
MKVMCTAAVDSAVITISLSPSKSHWRFSQRSGRPRAINVFVLKLIDGALDANRSIGNRETALFSSERR